MIVERTDFVSVPVSDMERATRFYRDTLGLPQIGDQGFPEFQLGENVSLYLVDPTAWEGKFKPHETAGSIALRVSDVEDTRKELEAKGIEFDGETRDSSVCHMAFFKDTEGNALMLHRRYAPPA